jgi:ABC-type antimicrobial peptide transport system permease subunit
MRLLGLLLPAILFVAIIIVPLASADDANVTPSTTPFITIDPIGNHTAGDVFFINGTTRDSTTENVSVHLDTFCNMFRPHLKSEISPEYYTISNIPIEPGENGVNRWSANITDFIFNNSARKQCQVMIQYHNSTYLWYECDPNCNHWMVFTDSGATADFNIFQKNDNSTNVSPYFGYYSFPSPENTREGASNSSGGQVLSQMDKTAMPPLPLIVVWINVIFFMIFIILMICDYITTEWGCKLGLHEKRELLVYFAGKPIPHRLVKIICIIIIWIITIVLDNFYFPYGAYSLAVLLCLMDSWLFYIQINNLNEIYKEKNNLKGA